MIGPLNMDDRARIIVLAQENQNLFSFIKDFCCLAVTSALNNETLKTLFWIGATFQHHIDLPDTIGLDWRETVIRCLESAVSRSGTQSTPSQTESYHPP